MHVPKVFDRFEIKTMKDYHGLYLLVDVFQKFRNASLKKYGLCPNHYLSSTTLSWDTILSMIKVKPELISDVDTYFFFEKGMKVGLCHISKRYSQASNNYLKSHEPKQEWKHIIYLDRNNLYGFAMSKFVTTGGFEWIDPKEFDLNGYSSNSSTGCVLEVNLEYTIELHVLRNNYPLAIDKIEIKKEMLFNYQSTIVDFHKIPIGTVKTLLSNVFDKTNMSFIMKTWGFLEAAIKIKKIHRVFEFKQS